MTRLQNIGHYHLWNNCFLMQHWFWKQQFSWKLYIDDTRFLFKSSNKAYMSRILSFYTQALWSGFSSQLYPWLQHFKCYWKPVERLLPKGRRSRVFFLTKNTRGNNSSYPISWTLLQEADPLYSHSFKFHPISRSPTSNWPVNYWNVQNEEW